MLNGHAVARALTVADLTPMQADPVRQTAEQDAPVIARRCWPSRTSPYSVRRCRRTSPHLHAPKLGRQDQTGLGLMGARLARAARGGVARLMVSSGREHPAVTDSGR